MLTTKKLKLTTKCFMKNHRTRFNLEKPKDPIIAEVFQPQIGGKFAALCVLDSDVDTLANSLKKGLLSTAEDLKRSLRDRERRFNLRSQLRFWICATRDVSSNNRSTQALKQD